MTCSAFEDTVSNAKTNSVIINSERTNKLNKDKWKEFTKDLNYPEAKPLVQRKKTKSSEPISAGWLMYLVYAALIALLIFIITRLLRIKVNKKVVNSPVIFSEEQAADEFIPDAPYEKYLSDAITEGNLRMAVRFSYLITLRDLSGIRLITISKDKTNYEYLLELIKNPLQDLFRDITRVFEKSWYGEIEITPDEFSGFEKKFEELKYQIKNPQ